VRCEDEQTIKLLEFLNHTPTEITVKGERAFLRTLEGGCQVPIAAFARLHDGKLCLTGMVAEIDGSQVIKDEIIGEAEQAEAIGIALARKLLEAGAGQVLARIYRNVIP
jgi:hydroxymethylbilane synthase